jgi:PAS domain S-box-containing protein
LSYSPVHDETAPTGVGGVQVSVVETTLHVAAEKALAAFNATLEQQVAERTAERDRMWRLSTDLMLVATMNGTITADNPAWGQLLGWHERELIGKTFLEFVHPDDIDATLAEIAKLDAGQTTFRFENRYRRKDDRYRVLSWTAVPEGGFLHGVARDVTAEREASEALQRTEETLRQSQKMEAVGQLTGGIAHDFNNMLTVVGGSLELLGRRLPADDERSHRYIDSAVEGVRRASTLTQRLLAFSRQQPLKPEAIDPNKLVSGMSDLLRHSLGAAIRLETALAAGLWRVHVDPNQLENVILNLAVNARDAMSDGGRLTIETQNAHLDTRYAAVHAGVLEGQYVMIAVTDIGRGMPPDVIATSSRRAKA